MAQTGTDSSRDCVPRRRAAQACGTCRLRKTRCDAGVPKCSLCMDLNVDCVYLDPQFQKIDPSTRTLLDRIQRLEDRLFSAAIFQSAPISVRANTISTSQYSPSSVLNDKGKAVSAVPWPGRSEPPFDFNNSLMTLPVTHDANADHVYRWPIVQEILARDVLEEHYTEGLRSTDLLDATDVFLVSSSQQNSDLNPESWHLFNDFEPHSSGLQFLESDYENSMAVQSRRHEYIDLIQEFFINAHAFYPILQQDQICEILHRVVKFECNRHTAPENVEVSQYCLLLLVLCLGALSKFGEATLSFSSPEMRRCSSRTFPDSAGRQAPGSGAGIQEHTEATQDPLWGKARLLLGSVSSKETTAAAQCFALARATLEHKTSLQFSDPFRRLFWVIYVNESDLAAEFSFYPPSGITRFEELVPYPFSEPPPSDFDIAMDLGGGESPSHTSLLDVISPCLPLRRDLAAFQISTNSAIRRFLNRITAVMYNPQEAWRKENHRTYVTWLLKIATELQDHHDALHANLPAFLLSTDLEEFGGSGVQDGVPQLDPRSFSNHLWNVSRLRGRYFAGQYLIHRPLFEYILLNPYLFETHPYKAEILEKCKLCLNGCYEFIRLFSAEPINCTTNVFAIGMATFAMVTILMLSTTASSFRELLPADIEEVISMGKENMRCFEKTVEQFQWHLMVLEKLDRGRKASDIRSSLRM